MAGRRRFIAKAGGAVAAVAVGTAIDAPYVGGAAAAVGSGSTPP